MWSARSLSPPGGLQGAVALGWRDRKLVQGVTNEQIWGRVMAWGHGEGC